MSALRAVFLAFLLCWTFTAAAQVAVPPLALQRLWASSCDPMLTLCRNLVRKNAKLRITRDLLLPKLISGEIDVSEVREQQVLAA